MAVCRHLPSGAGVIGRGAGGGSWWLWGKQPGSESPRAKARAGKRPRRLLGRRQPCSVLLFPSVWWQDGKIRLEVFSFQQIKLILQSSCASPLPLEIINTIFSELVLLERPHLLGRPCEIYVCLLI